ncbi:hypothetical protein AAFF_G00049020 [Aldrovandia affinis]|uniref:Uncharacterized protein n=1 Tax=Aldrovandia affinis TaxID=143900 RepID=A0AAD7S181_9TELE|nr:hypothetical protein AAFF_G00049020 [Aldrovandia affinis]
MALNMELQQRQTEQEKLLAQRDDVSSQLQEVNHANSRLLEQHEKEVLGVGARYEKELRGLHEDKNRTEEEIRSQLRNEKARTRELESLQQTVEELQAQIQSMEGTKGWFERRLKEAEETAEKSALEHQEQVSCPLRCRVQTAPAGRTLDGRRLAVRFGRRKPADSRVDTQAPDRQADRSTAGLSWDLSDRGGGGVG